jgi:hypothetical protein
VFEQIKLIGPLTDPTRALHWRRLEWNLRASSSFYQGVHQPASILISCLLDGGAYDMTLAINVLGWIGAAALLTAYWLVSTQKTTGNSRTYQGVNLLGATLVLVNSLYFGAYPSVGVNAAWIAIGAYTLAKHLSHATIRGRYSEAHRR